MNITIDDLYAGKATIIKNRDYLATKEYVAPFIDEMSKVTSDFRIKVKLPDQITVGDKQDVTYNRVLIEAVLPKTHSIEKYDEVVGFLYGLDVRKPISKMYRGYLNTACTNLTVFNPNWMIVDEIKPGETMPIKNKQLLQMANDFELTLKKLKTDFLDREKLFDRLGSWVDASLRQHYHNGVQNVKISPTVPVEAYKLLFIDEDSPYYVKKDQEVSMETVYNAFTQLVTNDEKDIMNKFEKTMMINKLLGV